MRRRFAAIAILAFTLAACGGDDATETPPVATDTAAQSNTPITRLRLRNAERNPSEWITYGGNYDEHRHSGLDAINRDNVDQLGVAWSYSLGTSRGIEATPIVANGRMFVTGSWSVVHALDARTGQPLWTHDPEVDKAVGVKACCDVVNRGVAILDGTIFVGIIDGRLQALDAETGALKWSVVTVDQSRPYTITGAPRVVAGKVLIGNGGADLGVRGYLSAYDADDGSLVWRFYTTPNPNKEPDGAASDTAFARFANATWGDSGRWQTDGGGGTVWDSIVYDEVNDQVIFGVGNGSPWNWQLRDPSGGDNLFISSIVAVDADSGAYRWHYQTTPGDTWDYTATQSIILADLAFETPGTLRRVVMQAPKNGHFYVLDAETGAFLSGTPFVAQNWNRGLDTDGRPIIEPAARDLSVPYLQLPGPLGAHNWHPMAFNPELGLAYIPAQELPQAYADDPLKLTKPGRWNTGSDFSVGVPVDVPNALLAIARASMKGRLIAWDPIARAPRWSVDHAQPWNGGVLSTAGGLVFQGQPNGNFVAYDAASGDQLWQTNVNAGAASGPVSYAIDGEQYVTVTTGWGSIFSMLNGFLYDPEKANPLGRVVTFKLGGDGELPAVDYPVIDRTPKAEAFGTQAQIEAGNTHFARNCMVCHGAFAISSGMLPDLRWSPYTANAEAWQAVVHDGALAGNGMVSFAPWLDEDDIEAVRAYVVHRAHASQ